MILISIINLDFDYLLKLNNQLKNYMKLTIWKIRQVFEKIFHWGNEKLTIMVIPHSEETVIKIPLSNYLLIFLFLILSVVVFFAVNDNFKPGKNVPKIQKLVKAVEKRDEFITSLDLQFYNLEKQLKLLTQFGIDLNLLIWKDFNKDILEEYYIKLSGSHDLLITQDDYHSLVKKSKKLRLRLEKIKSVFDNAANILITRMDIFYNMPRGSPFKFSSGHYTSSFGRRVDPFLRKNKSGGFVQGFHPGQDIAAPGGTPIYATADGVVSLATPGGGGGLGIFCQITHKYNYRTVYGHMREVLVKQGQVVKRFQKIGLVGMTGYATGNHLHYEVHIGDDVVNPIMYLFPFRDKY